MLTYICRCCAAALDVKSGMTVCRCSYCDVLQTLPRLDHDEKAVLWERAEALRRGGEYDRALPLYGELTELDGSDPDCYWSRTLCRYGVEYVEEQGSRKRIPTLNRIQYAPVIDDEDYRTAVRLADNDQRRVYMDEAMRLEALRKDIIEVSLTEQPYDIFICYKETDASGRRTADSVLAGQVYRALCAEGWRVFFARVSLEEKAGTMFEPYIFAALNSARLMLAVGTSPENFNAVWVRNEWSRYLYRMSEKGEGELAVLYKNMLPEHLPEEFSHLQRFDMSQPDVMEELIRGARKLLAAGQNEEPDAQQEQTDGVTAATLLRRAELALEDGEFESAWTFSDRALDAEPENATAYLYKLLADHSVSSIDALAEVSEDIGGTGTYKKLMRFAEPELAQRISDIRSAIVYKRSVIEYENAVNEHQFAAIGKRFGELGDYLDSAELAQKCEQRVEELMRENADVGRYEKYLEAKRYYDEADSAAYITAAMRIYRELGSYKDSRMMLQRCEEKMVYIREDEERRNAEAAKKREADERWKKSNVISLLLIGGLLLAFVLLSFLTAWIVDANKYEQAMDMQSMGMYDDAIELLETIPDYRDSELQVRECKYRKATKLADSGSYDEAAAIFREIGNYSDSKEMSSYCYYEHAHQLVEQFSYKDAKKLYRDLGDYKDSAEKYQALVKLTGGGYLSDHELQQIADVLGVEELGYSGNY